MSTHNKDFYEEISKIISELSSNMHLIISNLLIVHNFRGAVRSKEGNYNFTFIL